MEKHQIPKTGEIIYQDKDILSFSLDSVLLDEFASKKGILGDIGSGTGFFSLRGANNPRVKEVHAFEILRKAQNCLEKSIEANGLEGKIVLHKGDIKEQKIPSHFFDTLITNPPFYLESLKGEKEGVNQGKHLEFMEDWFSPIGKWLKPFGKLYIVFPVDHLAQLFVILQKNHLEPKRIRFVHKKQKAPAFRVLLECVRLGKPYLKIEDPLFLYDEKGEYTWEVKNLYE